MNIQNIIDDYLLKGGYTKDIELLKQTILSMVNHIDNKISKGLFTKSDGEFVSTSYGDSDNIYSVISLFSDDNRFKIPQEDIENCLWGLLELLYPEYK